MAAATCNFDNVNKMVKASLKPQNQFESAKRKLIEACTEGTKLERECDVDPLSHQD